MRTVEESSSTALATESLVRVRVEQMLFPFAALLIVGTVFLGFARTFFLAPLYDFQHRATWLGGASLLGLH